MFDLRMSPVWVTGQISSGYDGDKDSDVLASFAFRSELCSEEAHRLANLVSDVKAEILALKNSTDTLIVTDLPEGLPYLTIPKSQLSYTLSAKDTPMTEREWTTSYAFGRGRDPRLVLDRYMPLADMHPKLLAKLTFSLYNQPIEFAGSVRGAIAFLHDHIELHRVLRHLRLTYRMKQAVVSFENFPGRVLIPRANLWDFRRFSNIAVHKLSGLHSYHLRVQEEFWAKANWNQKAERIFHQKNLCEDTRYVYQGTRPVNFLKHFARLFRSVDCQLAIDGVNTPNKQVFLDALRKVIDEWQAKRTDCVEVRTCCCGQEARDSGKMEYCCLWVLPPHERKDGIQVESKEEEGQAEEERMELVHEAAIELRRALRKPDLQIALDFLEGPHYKAFMTSLADAQSAEAKLAALQDSALAARVINA